MTNISTEYCPKCCRPRELSCCTFLHEEINSNGEIEEIQTKNFICSECNYFVRSEEIVKAVYQKPITEKS